MASIVPETPLVLAEQRPRREYEGIRLADGFALSEQFLAGSGFQVALRVRLRLSTFADKRRQPGSAREAEEAQCARNRLKGKPMTGLDVFPSICQPGHDSSLAVTLRKRSVLGRYLWPSRFRPD